MFERFIFLLSVRVIYFYFLIDAVFFYSLKNAAAPAHDSFFFYPQILIPFFSCGKKGLG